VGPIPGAYSGSYPVQYAVLPRGVQPLEIDWVSPIANPQPGHSGEFGVWAEPVSEPGHWQIWGRIDAGTETVVRGPYDIGTIYRK
jgi:hypothetical protein